MAAKNFENFKILPDFPINLRESHQISKNYLKSSESYGQKPFGGSLKTPPVAALSIFIKSSGPSNYIVVKQNEEHLILAALSTIYSFYIPTSLYNSLVSLFQYSPIHYFTLIQYNF